MTDQALLPAIRETIKQNEIGDASPYKLSYAKLGKSGASFGVFQGDTNVSPLARDTLRQVLKAADANPATVDRIMAAVSKPCPNGSPLSPADATLTDNALSSASGRPLVDAMDNKSMQTVLKGVDSCSDAAASRNCTIAPIAVLYIAPWVNMSGTPTTLAAWLKGTPEMGLPPPQGPVVSQADLETYLQATAYFSQHPKNFQHLKESVAKGAVLLPAA